MMFFVTIVAVIKSVVSIRTGIPPDPGDENEINEACSSP